ncbi:MAG: D-alanine--D-alanine ligase, partial [Spirosomaceae bacterium]|nr:D-alanine--D-alanine ligase [Spirosomataceae bacterium]
MTNKIKVGIFFGGQSREREISFRGGRTTLDHINKAIFEPVPIFIDSLGNFILINPELLYEEAIPTFYP